VAAILEMAENEARRRDCRAGVLLTINFQAPGFYQRLGWRVFGEIPCDPPGMKRNESAWGKPTPLSVAFPKYLHERVVKGIGG
jgi:hypothetical protein